MPQDPELAPKAPVHLPDPGSDFDSGRNPEEGIALCLSGGGYRAMLFSLDALWRLNECVAAHGKPRKSGRTSMRAASAV
jgi:hypothetical protein